VANVEILTSQNVPIQYELAPLRDRFFAWALDLIILVAIITAVSVLASYAFSIFGFNKVWMFVLYPFLLLYHPLFEVLMDGQTPGKRMVGLKVMKLNGREPTISDYLIRWVFRLVDITLSMGGVGALLISTTDRQQRLGGLLSDTIVVRIRPTRSVLLQDILNMHATGPDEFEFPGVTRFTETDMLLMKSVVEEYERHPNAAHKQAFEEMISHVSLELGLEKAPLDGKGFVRQLIREYVALTR
jgi:uncharacterized RDD family membrane protein YckC